MVELSQVKSVALAICQVSKLNTSFHHYIKSEHANCVLTHGQALKLVAKSFGYNTYKGLTLSIDNGTLSLDQFKYSFPNFAELKEWFGIVKSVSKSTSGQVNTTLAGVVAFLLESEFNPESEFYNYDFVSVLLAIDPNPIWKESKVKYTFDSGLSLHARIELQSEYDADFFLSSVLSQTSDYRFFSSLIRSALMNSYEYGADDIRTTNLLGKAPSSKLDCSNSLFTLNLLVGDLFPTKDALNRNTVSNFALLPYHDAQNFKDHPLGRQIVSNEFMNMGFKGRSPYHGVQSLMDGFRLRAVSETSELQLKNYLIQHGITHYHYDSLCSVFVYAESINNFIRTMMLKDDYTFPLFSHYKNCNYAVGTSLRMYHNIFKNLEASFIELTGHYPENIEEKIFIDRNGLVMLNPSNIKSLTIHHSSYSNGTKQTVTPLKFSLILNAHVLKKIVAESRDDHVLSNKWLYLGMLMQFEGMKNVI